jgi:hypothetical protein
MNDLSFSNGQFTWVRAPEEEAARKRRVRAIAAVVFVVASFCAGLALGLVSSALRTTDRQQTKAPVGVAKPADHVVKYEPMDTKVTKPETASPPTLALRSDPVGGPKSMSTDEEPRSVPSSRPPVVLLNPGAANGGQKDGRLSSRRLRVSGPQTPASQSNPAEIGAKPPPVHRPAHSPNMKDYRSLRDYMLGQ